MGELTNEVIATSRAAHAFLRSLQSSAVLVHLCAFDEQLSKAEQRPLP
jgi:hypothetical protein